MMNYKILKKEKFEVGEYSLVPIRMEDRYAIMQWRNEQIYHLRQNKPLTKEDQDAYFENVVANLFYQEQPTQILFSFLEGALCIGYGGLVHINWRDRNAEVSFLMDSRLETEFFALHWKRYLQLLEIVAFTELELHKIFVYAFDLRPHLYRVLEESMFFPDARLKEHCYFDGKFIDVVIHSKFKMP